MAAVHGRNTYISVDTTDISAYCDNSELSQDTDTDETSAYGDDNKTYIAGLIDSTFSCEGKYDNGASGPKAIIEAVIDGQVAVALVRRPEGTGSGLPEENFSAICESYVETNPVGGKITWSSDWQVTGPITRSTQA